jgi:hypothetical protein
MIYVLIVAQFVGLSPVPLVPKNDPDLTNWYSKVHRLSPLLFSRR